MFIINTNIIYFYYNFLHKKCLMYATTEIVCCLMEEHNEFWNEAKLCFILLLL